MAYDQWKGNPERRICCLGVKSFVYKCTDTTSFMPFHFRWAKLSLGKLRFNIQQSNPFLNNSYRPGLCFHFLMKITEVIVTQIELVNYTRKRKKKKKGNFGPPKIEEQIFYFTTFFIIHQGQANWILNRSKVALIKTQIATNPSEYHHFFLFLSFCQGVKIQPRASVVQFPLINC